MIYQATASFANPKQVSGLTTLIPSVTVNPTKHHDMSNRSFDGEARPRRQSIRYLGEDRSITTKKELYGWYSYSVAAEAFAVVGAGTQILQS